MDIDLSNLGNYYSSIANQSVGNGKNISNLTDGKLNGKSDDELMDVLQLMNPEMGIPFPETEPYFTKDGLFFPYQQYEICSYAQGMPSFTIPYDKLGKYLNTTGKNLIK